MTMARIFYESPGQGDLLCKTNTDKIKIFSPTTKSDRRLFSFRTVGIMMCAYGNFSTHLCSGEIFCLRLETGVLLSKGLGAQPRGDNLRKVRHTTERR